MKRGKRRGRGIKEEERKGEEVRKQEGGKGRGRERGRDKSVDSRGKN